MRAREDQNARNYWKWVAYLVISVENAITKEFLPVMR